MMQRNMEAAAALRQAYAALQDGAFATARDLAAPWRAEPAGALLHALGRGGAGDAAGAAPALAAIAAANPAARHPVHDLVGLLHRHRAGPAGPHLRAALAAAPGDAGLQRALAAALAEEGPAADALAGFERLAGQHDTAGDWSNLGKALAAEARFEQAEAAFARAARHAPDDPQIRFNHAVARLKSGRLAEAWPLFRARHALPGRAPPPAGPELRSLDGIAGRRLLLVHDEGLGDTLQFIRFAPLLQARGAAIAVQAPPPLERLLRQNGFAVGGGRADAWCRIPDLAGLFGTTVETIPAPLPYLRADAGLAAHWGARLPPGRRVGIVWAGAARAHDPAAAAADRIRSLPPALLAPLWGVPDVVWVNLQLGQRAPAGVHDPMPGVRDLADTAAIVSHLDTVVSVDTAVAHLAAAMGRPVLLLDRYDACWRWLHGRTDSPWYPGVVRIVRQPAPGDWASVVAATAGRLIPGVVAP